jgi:hypothetical protein
MQTHYDAEVARGVVPTELATIEQIEGDCVPT